MRTCGNCGKKFKTFVKIEGKTRNLQRRKYCLECSPFGKHNTRNFQKPATGIGERSEDQKRRDKEKYRRWQKKARKERKQKLVDMLGGKCNRCGYDKCVAALQFHHLREKEFSISYWLLAKWERVLKEIKKCELVCANCHSEIHYIGIVAEMV